MLPNFKTPLKSQYSLPILYQAATFSMRFRSHVVTCFGNYASSSGCTASLRLKNYVFSWAPPFSKQKLCCIFVREILLEALPKIGCLWVKIQEKKVSSLRANRAWADLKKRQAKWEGKKWSDKCARDSLFNSSPAEVMYCATHIVTLFFRETQHLHVFVLLLQESHL